MNKVWYENNKRKHGKYHSPFHEITWQLVENKHHMYGSLHCYVVGCLCTFWWKYWKYWSKGLSFFGIMENLFTFANIFIDAHLLSRKLYIFTIGLHFRLFYTQTQPYQLWNMKTQMVKHSSRRHMLTKQIK
jgi:hypothetical protein